MYIYITIDDLEIKFVRVPMILKVMSNSFCINRIRFYSRQMWTAGAHNLLWRAQLGVGVWKDDEHMNKNE